MYDEFVIQAITQIANARFHKDYPMCDNHFQKEEVKYICDAMYDLTKKIVEEEKKKNE